LLFLIKDAYFVGNKYPGMPVDHSLNGDDTIKAEKKCRKLSFSK
jgi:hypothetical protein